ncbi:MAG: hypothetical protein HUU01_08885 [Saprospiraceae bacterium]|nr:hypothetical protein [Saprospiraceae bacterium]
MQRSRLIIVLKTLDLKARTRFIEYVASPFFNKNEKVRRLCSLVLQYAPDFEHSALHKKAVYKYVFQQEGYADLPLNNVISDLLQLLYDFLALHRYQAQMQLKRELLLGELLDRELYGEVERFADKAIPVGHYETYLHAYRLHEKSDEAAIAKGKRGYNEHLQQGADAFDLYYYCNKLRIACDMASRNAVIQAGYECHFLPEVLAWLEQNTAIVEAAPILQVYLQALQMLQETDQAMHYFALKSLLAQHIALFSRQELQSLYHYCLNFCVRQINSGQGVYYREVLDLYKLLLQENILLQNGHLSQWAYNNIITAGIRLREYDWTGEFIKRYREFLQPDAQHNAYTYNLATLFYEKGEPAKALQQLQNVEFTDAFYHLSAKIIQLKSYYALNETEPFMALLEATRKFLSRNNQLSDYQKKSNANFVKLSRGLFQLRQCKSLVAGRVFRQRNANLLAQVQRIQPLANKDWLEEALKRLGSD